MNQIPDILYANEDFTTWLILGASRGIGLEFVRQLLTRDERIIATVREPFAAHASQLWGQAGSDHGRCQMYTCDILSEQSIEVLWILVMSKRGCELTRPRNSLPR
jgi:NAD(P)-dependent dehydrogenase (short-subunit alcohol dehydrogenase family)